VCRHPAKQRGVTVHEVRKHLKKLRAALRLTKSEVGKNRWVSEDRCLREIGRLVSDLRDAHVRLQTLIQLRDDASQQFPRIEELLSMERESFSAAFAGWQKQAVPKLERAGERLLKWPLAEISWKQICGVVAKTYRRGQNRLAKALKKRDPESFHVWRMSVKELWYQLRVLRPLNRLVLEEIASDAKTLGELLGRAHDFAFLLARLDKERGDQALYDELTQLQKLIRKRGKRLHRDALELGRRFYAEPSKAFAKRISIFIDKRKS
jgi:CHAD domain-containing protein